MCKNKFKSENAEPQLVLNPITKKYVNITPLWYILHEHYSDRINELSECIDVIIRKLSLENHQEIKREEEKSMLYDLYNVKDILDNLSEYQNK